MSVSNHTAGPLPNRARLPNAASPARAGSCAKPLCAKPLCSKPVRAALRGMLAALAMAVVSSGGVARGDEAMSRSELKGPTVLAATHPDGRPRLRQSVLMGSSSFGQALGRIIAADLSRAGYEVYRKSYSSAGLARPDFRDVTALLENLPISGETDTVFVYLGMNDTQSIWLRPEERKPGQRPWLSWNHPRWSEVYQRRATEFFSAICDRGVTSAIVLLPVDVVGRERLQGRIGRIRRLQALAAQATSCATAISTSGDIEDELRALRLSDGVHLNRKGAQLVWDRIRDHVKDVITYREQSTRSRVSAQRQGRRRPSEG